MNLFSAFFEKRAIPVEYREAWQGRLAEEWRSAARTLSFVIPLINIFIIGTYALLGEFQPVDLVLTGSVVVFYGALFVRLPRLRSLSQARAAGMLCSVPVLVILIGFVLLGLHEAPDSAASSLAEADREIFSSDIFMFVLLSFTLLMPATLIESLVIGALPLLCYLSLSVLLAASWPEAVVNTEFVVTNTVMLSGALLSAGLINQIQDLRRRQNFVLEKENEKKQKQIERDLDFAGEISRSLIPRSFSNEQLEVSVSYVPMLAVGGDYANFQSYPDGSFEFIITDITGHGVPAALMVNRLHTEVERLFLESKEAPGKLMQDIDAFVKTSFEATGMFLSGFCGRIHLKARSFTYSNFGHPPALLRRNGAGSIEQLRAQTCLVGAPIPQDEIHETRLEVQTGDRLVLYTDGVTETFGVNREMYGEERLSRLLQGHQGSAADFNQAVIEDLARFRVGEVTDDIFLITIEIKS